MKVLFLARATFFKVFGGDTVQAKSTAKYLEKLGVDVDIKLVNEEIAYSKYDLIHVFNATRPADVLRHLKKSGKPYVLSTIYVDFSESEKKQRNGMSKLAARMLSPDQLEYLKAVIRMLKNGEMVQSPEYLFVGHWQSVRKLARNAAMLLPNSHSELRRFQKRYNVSTPAKVIYNGIDEDFFPVSRNTAKNDKLIICVARIELSKNQLNLIKALNNTDFQLKIIGKPAPNHMDYYDACKQAAGDNVTFEGFVPQEQLYVHYKEAKVHVLPSWNETCGLTSLEAGWYGCNIVVTRKGDTEEYYDGSAWFCEPDDIKSIRRAVIAASESPVNNNLTQKIKTTYNWKVAAEQTLRAYQAVLEMMHK